MLQKMFNIAVAQLFNKCILASIAVLNIFLSSELF